MKSVLQAEACKKYNIEARTNKGLMNEGALYDEPSATAPTRKLVWYARKDGNARAAGDSGEGIDGCDLDHRDPRRWPMCYPSLFPEGMESVDAWSLEEKMKTGGSLRGCQCHNGLGECFCRKIANPQWRVGGHGCGSGARHCSEI